MTADPAIDAQLSVRVGERSASFSVDATLSLARGVLVLFGASGVGKTLTLKALAGLLPCTGHLRTQGTTLLDSAAGVDVPAHRRRVGYVPQEPALFPFLDVAANVAFGRPRSADGKARVARWLEELGITHLARRRPDALSGGERQRVALARALAVEPRLLLLDEPFASLDHDAASQLRQVVRDVIQRHDVPAVLVTHDADEARFLGDTVVRFVRGRTAESGTPGELLRRHYPVTLYATVTSVEARSPGRVEASLREARLVGPSDLLQEGTLVLESCTEVPGTEGRG